MQLQLHYIAQHYTRLIILHYGYNYDCNYTCNYHYTARHDPTPTILDHITTTTTLPYTTLYHTAIHNTTIQYITIHYTNNTTTTTATANTLHLLHITITTPLHHTTTTLHHTTSSNYGKVNTATITTTPKNATPTTCQSISGFALPSVIHNNQPFL